MSSTITALTSGGGLAMAGDTSGQLELKTNNGTTAVTVTTAQDVGIGTGSPTTKAQVSATTGGSATGLSVVASGNMLNVFGSSSTNAGVILDATNGTVGSATGVPTIFRSGGTERMRITTDGYFKTSDNGTYISSTGVYHELMQSRNDSYACRIGVTAASGGGYPLQLCWTTQTNSNTTDRYLTCSDATNTKLQIFSNGNVQNLNGSYGTISDIKNKENIVDATPKLDKILNLKVRNFNLKSDDEKLKQIGFIAQEFEQVFPSLIEESPDLDNQGSKTGDTTKAIKTSVLVPILVKAIQELNAKVTALEEQVINLGVK